MIIWVIWAVWCCWFEALSRTANEIALWNNPRLPANNKFHNVPSGKLSVRWWFFFVRKYNGKTYLHLRWPERYFRACFSKEGWLEWIHVQGDGFKSVNKHWFDEGTSGGKLNHFFNLSCCFIPGCASFYLNNSTNQTKLAIRIDCSCIYKSITA